jgi:hypothetical protein
VQAGATPDGRVAKDDVVARSDLQVCKSSLFSYGQIILSSIMTTTSECVCRLPTFPHLRAGETALVFGVDVEDYATITALSQRRHIAMRSQDFRFGIARRSPLLRRIPSCVQGMPLNNSVPALPRFRDHDSQQEYVAKSSRKRAARKSTPEEVRHEVQNSTPSKSLKKILKSPPNRSALVFC